MSSLPLSLTECCLTHLPGDLAKSLLSFVAHSRYSFFNQSYRWRGRRRRIYDFVRVIALRAGEVMEMTSISSRTQDARTSGIMVNIFKCCVPFLITKLDHQSKSFFGDIKL